MLSKQNIKNWKSFLNQKEWKDVKGIIKQSLKNKNHENYIFEIQDIKIINKIEDFIVKSSIQLNKEDLMIDYIDIGGSINFYIQKFVYYFKEDIDFLNIIEHINEFERYDFLYYMLEHYSFNFSLIKNRENKMLLIVNIDLNKNISQFDYSIKLLSHKKVQSTKYFSEIDNISNFIEKTIGYKNKLNQLNIPIYFKNCFIGYLDSDYEQSFNYNLKIRDINKSDFKIHFKNTQENKLIPSYKVYFHPNLKNIFLITSYENRDYANYYFLKVSNELVNETNILKKYIDIKLFI